jgi:general secretion pathway protein E
MGVYEMMVMTPDLRKAISAETDLDGLRERAFREGMKPLRISGAMKIAAGQTTIDEVMTVAPPPGGDRRQR